MTCTRAVLSPASYNTAQGSGLWPGHVEKFLLMKFRVLETFFDVLSTLLFQLSLLPRWTPRYFADVTVVTRRPASADRTMCRKFQATGQPVSRTKASDAMTSPLPRYEAKCVQRRCFQCGSVALRSDIKGMELPPANILIPLERQLIALQLCR